MGKPPISRISVAARGMRPGGRAGAAAPAVVGDFPVLSAGRTPSTSLNTWTLALQEGGSHRLAKWMWAEFWALRQTAVEVDIHGVTTWSKLDTEWQG